MAEADCPGTTIAVQRGAWSHLSPELAALVAPPVTVSALPVTSPTGLVAWRLAQRARLVQRARSRANMPVAKHRRSTR